MKEVTNSDEIKKTRTPTNQQQQHQQIDIWTHPRNRFLYMQKKLRQEFKVSFIWWYTLLYMSSGPLSLWLRYVRFFFLFLSNTTWNVSQFWFTTITEKWWRIVPSARARVNFEDSNFWNSKVYFVWAMFVEFATDSSFFYSWFFFRCFNLSFFLSATLSKEWNSPTIKQKLYNTTAKKMKRCHDRHSLRVFQ